MHVKSGHLNSKSAEIFIPDGVPLEQAVERTTHLGVGAHQDDLEIMAAAPILHCFQNEEEWFTGVVICDGRGSPRDGIYKSYTDDEMRAVRIKEQKKAAIIGEYAALVLLDYPSKVIKEADHHASVEDISAILHAAQPRLVYTHNLADKHDTHVAVALKVIAAIRDLPGNQRPEKLYGCEVWRDLDWLVDNDKVPFELSTHESLQAALLGVYDSQISAGKRYDLAALGRRWANATYFSSHAIGANLGMTYAMDLTPIVLDPNLDVQSFIQEHIARFAQDVANRLMRVG